MAVKFREALKKLALVLCVLFSAFGLWSCSGDASADSQASSIETDVAALQAQVTALKSASAAQQTAIDTLQTTVDTLQPANVLKVYDNNDRLLGRAVGAEIFHVVALTSTGKLYATEWAGENSNMVIPFTTSDCTGAPLLYEDDGYPDNLIFHYNGSYYTRDADMPATSVIPLSEYYQHNQTCASSSLGTSNVYSTVTLTPVEAGLPATIAYPLIIKD
jgi:hypothetical protein